MFFTIARLKAQIFLAKPRALEIGLSDLSRNVFLLNGWLDKGRCFVNRVLLALVAFVVVGSALGQSPEPAKFRITTWNLEWFPNGSAREATPEKQAQRINAAASVLKVLNPDILLLQEVRDYDACARLAEAIQPGLYTVAICSAFKGGKQEEAILAKIL